MTVLSTPSPCNQQETIRIQLSTVLQAVISQLLLPRMRQAGARRGLRNHDQHARPSQALIRDNKTFRITSDIQTGGKYGMVTLDGYLMEMHMQGLISRDEVITKVAGPDHGRAETGGVGSGAGGSAAGNGRHQ